MKAAVNGGEERRGEKGEAEDKRGHKANQQDLGFRRPNLSLTPESEGAEVLRIGGVRMNPAMKRFAAGEDLKGDEQDQAKSRGQTKDLAARRSFGWQIHSHLA